MAARSAFSHIPATVLSAINDVGVAFATLDRAFGEISRSYHSGKLTVADGKLCLAMALVHHNARKYAGQFDPEKGAVRDSALLKRVNRAWREEVEGIKANDVEKATIRVPKAAQEQINTLVATYGLAALREALKRAPK